MKTNYLFPRGFKRIGLILFCMGLLLGPAHLILSFELEWFDVRVLNLIDDPVIRPKSFFKWVENNILDEIAGTLLIVGGVMLGFSREGTEDEFIARVRMESLIWAVYVQYGILLLCLWFLYGLGFYWVMLFNLFTLLLFFNSRFYWLMYRYRKEAEYEE